MIFNQFEVLTLADRDFAFWRTQKKENAFVQCDLFRLRVREAIYFAIFYELFVCKC